MLRIFVVLFLAMLCFGCHSAPKPNEPTRLAAGQRFGNSFKHYFTQAVTFAKPDTEQPAPPAEKPSIFAAALETGLKPAAAETSPKSLYKADSLFASSELLKTDVAAPATEIAQTLQSEIKPAEEKEVAANTVPQGNIKRKLNKNLPQVKEIEPEPEDEDDFNGEPEEIAEVKVQKKLRQKKIRNENDEPEEELTAHHRRNTVNELPPPQSPQYPNLPQLPQQSTMNGSPVVQAHHNQTSYNQAPYQQAAYHQATANQFIPNAVPQGFGAGDWQTPLKTAAEQLRYAIDRTPGGKSQQNEMRLRLIETLLGNKGESAKPMSSADKAVSEFMGHQVLGLAALLDDPNGESPKSKARYMTAAYRFKEALSELTKLCPIKIKNIVHINSMEEFGAYYPRTEDYKPGESFHTYLELDNLKVRRTTDGYNVSVAIKYEILDSNAKIVASKEGRGPSLTTISRKQDYCIVVDGTIPQTQQPGTYQLRVSVTDLNDESMQYAEEQIPLKVAPATEVE